MRLEKNRRAQTMKLNKKKIKELLSKWDEVPLEKEDKLLSIKLGNEKAADWTLNAVTALTFLTDVISNEDDPDVLIAFTAILGASYTQGYRDGLERKYEDG